MCLNYCQVQLLPVDAVPAESVADADKGVAGERLVEVPAGRVGLVVVGIAGVGGSDIVVEQGDIDEQLVGRDKTAAIAGQAELDRTEDSFAIHQVRIVPKSTSTG